MDSLLSIWNTQLFTTNGGNAVIVGDAILVIGLLVAGYLLSKFLQFILLKRLAKTTLRPDAIYALKRASMYVLMVLIGLTILSVLGIPITVFAFATGAIAIGIGFGAQNIINNFISGWILVAERPIKSGDFIEIENAMGTVERIGARSTRIQRTDGVHLLVPNSKLLENTVTNWTLLDTKIRTSLRVGVSYSSDPKQVIALISQVINEHNNVLADPEPQIVFEDFADSTLLFEAFFWCDIMGDQSMRIVRSEIRQRMLEVFNENGVDIAYPQREVHLHAGQGVRVSVD